jgi:hypothetical protein
MMLRKLILLLIVLVLSLGAARAVAGVSYPDPPDGWTYIHNGSAANSASGWDHDNGSDEWDGSAIGAGLPGGISYLADDGTYVRVQDPFPRDPGAEPSNRKIMLIRDIAGQDSVPAAVADQILSVEGITISFRARIATTGVLDLYDGSSAWPADGDGYGTHDAGKGNFTIHQEAGGDQTISFALALATEQPGNITSYMGGRQGLVMNALNGTSPSASVDAYDNEGTVKNVLELADPTQWHEFWITIEPDTSGGGTHLVTIWKDGSMVPDEFHVTAGNGGDEGYSYIALGCGSTNQAGAIDADFFAYKVGVHSPPGTQKKAHTPIPADDSRTEPTDVEGDGYYMLMTFSPGDGVTTHTAYFSSNFDDVNDRNPLVSLGSPPYPAQYPTGYYAGLNDPGVPEHARTPLERGITYYWVVDESNSTDTYPGDVWSFDLASESAYSPTPPNGAQYIDGASVALAWLKGDVDPSPSLSFDVYWGTDEAVVAADTTPDAPGVSNPTHTITSLLSDTDYYWKVNTVLTENQPPFTQTIIPGDVWQFKTKPFVPITDATRIGWWNFDQDSGTLVPDQSGYDNDGTIMGGAQRAPGKDGDAIDLSGGGGQSVQIELVGGVPTTVNPPAVSIAMWAKPDITTGQRMLWFTHESSGYGKLRCRIDGGNWQMRSGQGATADNVNAVGPAAVAGEWAHYVGMKIDNDGLYVYIDGEQGGRADFLVGGNLDPSSWIGAEEGNNNLFDGLIDDVQVYLRALSLKEIKVMAGRLSATDPDPANGAEDVPRTLTLNWSPGAFVAAVNGNILYHGADAAAVANRTATPVSLTNATYDLTVLLDLGQTYYWAVDTVNDSNTWPGDLWSFTTVNWLSVDNMEPYVIWSNPAGPHIFVAWQDGMGDCSAGNGNDTGANLTENADPVFGGVQSMKYDYDNDGTVYNPCSMVPGVRGNTYSKIEAQIAGLPSQIGTNWTVQGVKALSLRFYGGALNGVEPMWVQLSDGSKTYGNKVTYGDYDDEDPNAITEESWHEWFIDMADFGVELTNVVSLVIGFGNEDGSGAHGSGTVYFDDFRLYTPRCMPSRHTAEMAKADFAPLGAPDCRVDYKELDVMADDWLLGDALVTAAARPTPDPNLVAWWKFDDGSGATAINSSGTASALTLSGAITWEDGISGGAVHFRGVGSGTGTLGYNANAITVCAWVNHDVFVSGQVERYITVGSEVAVIRKENDGRLHFYIMTGGSLRHLWVSDVLTEDQWHYVVGAWDGLTQRLYIDGVLKAWQRPGGVLGTASSLNVSSSGEPFNGMLDDVRIYDYALTHGEVLSLAGVATLYVPVPSSAEIYEGEDQGSRVVNFKDYAELMDSWLVEIKYPQ